MSESTIICTFILHKGPRISTQITHASYSTVQLADHPRALLQPYHYELLCFYSIMQL